MVSMNWSCFLLFGGKFQFCVLIVTFCFIRVIEKFEENVYLVKRKENSKEKSENFEKYRNCRGKIEMDRTKTIHPINNNKINHKKL